jgi:hypothetical protein
MNGYTTPGTVNGYKTPGTLNSVMGKVAQDGASNDLLADNAAGNGSGILMG